MRLWSDGTKICTPVRRTWCCLPSKEPLGSAVVSMLDLCVCSHRLSPIFFRMKERRAVMCTFCQMESKAMALSAQTENVQIYWIPRKSKRLTRGKRILTMPWTCPNTNFGCLPLVARIFEHQPHAGLHTGFLHPSETRPPCPCAEWFLDPRPPCGETGSLVIDHQYRSPPLPCVRAWGLTRCDELSTIIFWKVFVASCRTGFPYPYVACTAQFSNVMRSPPDVSNWL